MYGKLTIDAHVSAADTEKKEKNNKINKNGFD